MGREALKASGIERSEIDRVEREYRLRDCERLERQTETGDHRAGWERAFTPERALPDEEVGSTGQGPGCSRYSSSAWTMASTTSSWAPSQPRTWICASAQDGRR